MCSDWNWRNISGIEIEEIYLALKLKNYIWHWNWRNISDIEIEEIYQTLKLKKYIWHWNWRNISAIGIEEIYIALERKITFSAVQLCCTPGEWRPLLIWSYQPWFLISTFLFLISYIYVNDWLISAFLVVVQLCTH